MLLITVVFIALSLMVIAWVFKKPAFAFFAAGFWIISGVVAYGNAPGGWTTWSNYSLAAWGCFGMGIVTVLEAMTLRTPEETKESQDSIDRIIEKAEKYSEKMERIDRATGGQRRHKTRYSNFAKTGKIDDKS